MDPHTQQTLTRGLSYHQAGQLAQAEAIYRQVLSREPQNPAALHLLGLLAHHVGKNQDAQQLIVRSLQLAPDVADFHNNYGMFLLATERVAEALAEFMRALDLNPQSPDAWNNLGAAHEARGTNSDALAAFIRAVELNPTSSILHNNAARMQRRMGHIPNAIASWKTVVQLNPNAADAHADLAAVFQEIGDLAAAIEHGQRAVELAPENVEALTNLANAQAARKQYDIAMELYGRAMELDPQRFETVASAAWALIQWGKLKEAEPLSRRAVALKPDSARAANDLALLLKQSGAMDEAIQLLGRATQLDPCLAQTWSNLGGALLERGQSVEAIDAFRRAIGAQPALATAHSNLLLALHCDPAIDVDTLYREHLHFAEVHERPLLPTHRAHRNDRNADRKLRVGYVSPHFANHAVATFVEPILRSHHKNRFTITCYSDVVREDDVTARMKSFSDQWISISGLTDEEAANNIREDRQDILVDLTGHISGNRMLVFARKPAPVQISYIGYQNTTGLASMDYRLTDAHADPPGATDRLYTEKLVRLPKAFFVYQPPENAPEPAPAPAIKNGYVTFGSLNNAMKVNPRLVATWASILKAVPNSRMLLLVNAGGFSEELMWKQFESQGIPRERVSLLLRTTRTAYLEAYSQIDIALDPFPFSGHTTTCDALWMGVGVITLGAGGYVSRMSRSVLANLNLQDLIAESASHYVEIALKLASHHDKRSFLRQNLRQVMRDSYICDAIAFTRDLEQTYQNLWRQFCSST